MPVELKEFISETIDQIISGVQGVQKKYAGESAIINPEIFAGKEQLNSDRFYHRTDRSIATGYKIGQHIEFDIAITTAETKEKEGKAGIFVPYLNIGGGISKEDANSVVSRIRFSVPIVLP